MISSDARTARERLLAAASELIDTLAQQGITQFSSHETGALGTVAASPASCIRKALVAQG